jgi:hypothetical protein
MSQYNAPSPRRTGGQLDVYTGLLFVATIVLGVGCAILVMKNMEHSSSVRTDGASSNDGALFKLVEK